MKNTEFDEINYIYIIKAFAIFSVVCAHSASIPYNFGYKNQLISSILNSFGSIGVPIFFLISGYLLNKNKRTFKEFFKRKITSIFLPWIFCETIVWLYVVLRKGGVSFLSWLSFLLGINHSTYYLTVLTIFFVVYFYLNRFNSFLIITGLISIISIVTTNLGVNNINAMTLTPYLNPINWMLYFSIGIVINKYRL